MNKILNAIKCAICREILESPVILPCYDTICKKHVINHINDVNIRCEQCGVEHQIPTNGFHPNNALKEIIDAEIANLELGSVHKEAKKSCESVEETLKELETILKDPHFYTHEKISELKNAVELKGEEMKLIIDKEIKKLIDRLEEYERKSKEFLSSYKFKVESKKLEKDLKLSKYNLDSWFESLNK